MSDKIGTVSLKRPDEEIFLGRDISRGPSYSEATAEVIDSEIKRILGEARDKALALISKNRAILDALAGKLIEKEVLDGEEVEGILRAGLSPA